MDEHIRALSRLTSSGDWPDSWLSLPEFIERLDQLGWWQRQGLGDGTPQRKRAFLRAALAIGFDEGTLVWAQVGERYKHEARLSDEEFRALVAFNRDAGAEVRAA